MAFIHYVIDGFSKRKKEINAESEHYIFDIDVHVTTFHSVINGCKIRGVPL